MNQELSIKLRDSQHTIHGVEAPDPLQLGPPARQGGFLGGLSRKARAAERDLVAKTRTPGTVANAFANDILPRAQFLQQLEREKRRADRSKTRLSILTFRLDAGIVEQGTSERLISALCASKRETDIVGYFGSMLVVVLLPDTNELGAKQFLQKTFDSTGALCCSTNVETYPDHLIDRLASEVCEPRTSLAMPLDDVSAPNGVGYFIKRVADFVGAAVILLVISPLMLVTAITIAVDSPGPIIFRQVRLGRLGRPFVFYKFRSMYSNTDQRVHRQYVTGLIARNNDAGGQTSDSKPWTKLSSDRRITRVGTFLRKTCIDEIPQLVNVLKGDLSLVGPRPPLPYEAAVYESWHLRRVLDITPGITGLWQVQGGNGTFDDMVRMDLEYMRSWSLMLDLKILIKTVVIVLRKNGGG